MTAHDVARLATAPLWVSRALEPGLRDELTKAIGVSELPILRGRTVVPESIEGTVILGHPNYLGRFEHPPNAPVLWIPGLWSELRPLPDGARVTALTSSGTVEETQRHVERTRRFAKQLRQISGVDLVAMPETPVLVILAAFNPSEHVDSLRGVSRLGADFPELPGAVRIEVPLDMTGPRFDRYAASVVGEITEES
ncbi:MAG: hypothetical protein ABFR89_03680 [Actinomycetota bacterium]